MNVCFKDLAHPSSCPPDPVRFNDTVTGTVVTMTEWIANELYRLQNNVRPRHCEHYEELVELIQEPKLLDSLTVPSQPPPPLPVYDDEDDDEESEDSEKSDNIPAEATKPTHAVKPSTVILCRVFIEIIRYCSRVGGPQSNHAPRLLLTEFEKLRQDKKLSNAVNPIAFRENLLKILFGKIQMTEQLVKCWKYLCEWVAVSRLDQTTWIEMSLNGYIAAQRFILAEHYIMRKYQKRNLKIATDIVICKK
ncbi:hypothetical protein INT47_005195 [Mucor saturninus]|uniref:Uncharacterized protein n=1 Tax=Mucor saturninus TaxID=64648 RepID=A0A8H7UXR4_9FUNG|nr:hypothetical protein INT47_005195 [Mucor saturninus]